jgi:hypothetical protein
MAAWSETLTRLGLQLLKPRSSTRRAVGRVLPPTYVAALGVLALALAVVLVVVSGLVNAFRPGPRTTAGGPGYLFCFWNVENFFDDREEKEPMRADAEFDRWFAEDKEALALKLKHLSKTLVKLNDGRGPDILALAEVESERAAAVVFARLEGQRLSPLGRVFADSKYHNPAF